jgi:elongator complex protein 1
LIIDINQAMRNLDVLRLTVSDAIPKLQNASSFTVCPGRDASAFVIANGSFFHVSGESYKVLLELSFVANGYLHDDGSDRVVGLEYVTELDAVCLATSSGDVLLCTPSTQKVTERDDVRSGL